MPLGTHPTTALTPSFASSAIASSQARFSAPFPSLEKETGLIRLESGRTKSLIGLYIKHSYTYTVFMKNVTLAIEEATLRTARRIAADRSTSLNAMIRRFLQELTERESQADQARLRILELCSESTAEVGQKDWNREQLHER